MSIERAGNYWGRQRAGNEKRIEQFLEKKGMKRWSGRRTDSGLQEVGARAEASWERRGLPSRDAAAQVKVSTVGGL